MPGLEKRDINRLRPLTAKLFRPFRVPRKILMTDSGSGIADGFDKVLQNERRLEKLLGFHAEPGHLHGTSIPG